MALGPDPDYNEKGGGDAAAASPARRGPGRARGCTDRRFRNESVGSTGHFRRTRGQSPNVLRVGAAESAPQARAAAAPPSHRPGRGTRRAPRSGGRGGRRGGGAG